LKSMARFSCSVLTLKSMARFTCSILTWRAERRKRRRIPESLGFLSPRGRRGRRGCLTVSGDSCCSDRSAYKI
jgi:hypothetical protein